MHSSFSSCEAFGSLMRVSLPLTPLLLWVNITYQLVSVVGGNKVAMVKAVEADEADSV